MKYLKMGNKKLKGKHGTALDPVDKIVKTISKVSGTKKIFCGKPRRSSGTKKHILITKINGGFTITVKMQRLSQCIVVYTNNPGALTKAMNSIKK